MPEELSPTLAPAPLPNSPESRSQDGTILDQSAAPSTTPADTPTEPASPAPRAPESYSFTAPEGRSLDAALIDRATPVFRELNLDQASAQKLVDLVAGLQIDTGKVQQQLVNDMRAGWRTAFAQDPEMGSRTEQIITDIGRFKDTVLGPPNSPNRKAFDEAMNLTGAGDHPAIIRAMWAAAQRLGAGSHVSGTGPSPHGQTEAGIARRPSAAASLYPNLPH